MEKGTIIGGIVLALAAAGIGLLLWKVPHPARFHEQGFLASSTESAQTGSVIHNETGPAYTYTNAAYHFTLSFPKELHVTEYAEKGGERTITFEESDKVGFQIFIVPYKDNQITQSRIDLDTRRTAEKPVQAVVGGTPALLFFSKDPVLGRLREVWFLHDGYLYEVTTYAELDSWLAGIMNSWRFQ